MGDGDELVAGLRSSLGEEGKLMGTRNGVLKMFSTASENFIKFHDEPCKAGFSTWKTG